MVGSLYMREKDCCLEDSTDEQVTLVDCFMFQQTVLQMGFQGETYCTGKHSSVQ